MDHATNVISLRKFRWHKRLNSLKQIASDRNVIVMTVISVIGVASAGLLSALIEKYPDAFGFLLVMPYS